MPAIQPACLWVVATPIGNRDDFSARAIDTLRAVAVIAAEDTRHSRPLLQHHNVATPLVALHEHNEREVVDAIVRRLQGGESVALISDADPRRRDHRVRGSSGRYSIASIFRIL